MSAAACSYCRAAQIKPDYPMYRNGCPGCGVRAIAQGPQFHASGVDGTLSSAYRKALAGIFGDDWRRGHEMVKAEHQRIKDGRSLL